jgi:hypothetical protein
VYFEGGAVFGGFLGGGSARIEGLGAVTPYGCFLFAHQGDVGGWYQGRGAGGGATSRSGGGGGVVCAAAMDVFLMMGRCYDWSGIREAVGRGGLG